MLRLYFLLILSWPLLVASQDISPDSYKYWRYKHLHDSCAKRFDSLNKIIQRESIKLKPDQMKKLLAEGNRYVECMVFYADSMQAYKPKELSIRD